ncbi:hypothetical protein ICA16_19885 [Pseudomonas anatoliensis]|uniref:TRADD-N-associated membrane domain-containing protein n=1 Tax=Pseudomonas anatoliensis TaxID=2710589 RepID=UPI001B32B55D|nr:hypothetical protein [Pseudomonas anatoliensis]MBP5957941.1 hypothetical protein [Pseudomonas anatoliensis]
MDVFLEFVKSSQFIAVFIGIITVFFKLLADYFQSRAARKLVLKAEKEAYHVLPSEELDGNSSECELSPELLAQRARDIDSLIRQNRDLLQVGRLFDLYSKQIEKYQTETQARAGWSFIFAIFSMLAGLSFVVGGGFHVLTNPGWEHVAAASAISGIGGAVGAFITKTFLDVHRLSLSQLNHYFRQPVVNAHVLTGQRLADQIDDPILRQKAYQHLLMQVASLIREDTTSPAAVWSPELPPKPE